MANKHRLPTLFFLGVVTGAFFLRLLPALSLIMEPFDLSQTEALYQHSQFAKKDPWFVIQDWELYPYAGAVYLATGDLSQVNVEHPPLGKYFYGLAVLTLKRPALVSALLVYLWLVLTFLVSRKVLANSWLALLLTLALILEPLWLIQASHPLLDLPFGLSVMAFLWLAVKYRPTLKQTLLLGILLGITAGIKFPAGAVILGASYLVWFFWQKRTQLVHPVGTILVAGLTYVAFYLPLFIRQGLAGFWQAHLTAMKLHLSHLPGYPPLAPLRVMLFNQWPVWWDPNQPIQATQEWSFAWPWLGGAVLSAPLFVRRIRRESPLLHLILLFTVPYFLFLNSRLFFPGYLVPLLPFFYILFVWEVKTLLTLVYQRRKPRQSRTLKHEQLK
jgi:predicted membrane-bound dolichyl-phosphate-mannose-protein mannosyltransferase